MKGYVSTVEGQIHYRRASPPKCSSSSSLQTILLLHQRPSSSSLWEPVLPLLAQDGFDAIAFDLPGHGESFHPGSDDKFTLAFFASTIAEAVTQLQVKTPVFVVGHHLGAGVAMQLAADFPEMVSKLALWGVPILEPGIAEKVPPPPDLEDEELTSVVNFCKIRNKFTARPGYVMPPELRMRRLVEMLQSSPKAADLIFKMDVNSLVGRISQPTLCMTGDKEMLDSVTRRTATELLNGRLCNIANAGLDVQDEYPEEFCRALAEFFSSDGS